MTQGTAIVTAEKPFLDTPTVKNVPTLKAMYWLNIEHRV